MRLNQNDGSSASTELCTSGTVVAVDEEAGMAAEEAQHGRCSGCRYWLTHGDPPDWSQQYGDCRRYPPTVVMGADVDTTEVQWPATERGEWCGEHKPAPEAPR